MQKNEKYLGFSMPSYGGMINHLMELEIRVGLAYLANRTMVSLNKYPIAIMQEDHLYKRYREASLLDLFDVPVKHISALKLYKRGFDSLFNLAWPGSCASEACYIDGNEDDYAPELISAFKVDRIHRWEFPQNDYDVWSCYVPRTFSSYSYFFLMPAAKRKKFLQVMKKVQPKAAYMSLAKKISTQLGDYNAIHVRRGDFKSWWVQKADANTILDTIGGFIEPEKPLLICSDEPSDALIFSPIVSRYPSSIFLEQFIINEFKKELEQLPYSDASVIALLTILIAGNAREFAGTPFSTFTAYIHRRRMLASNNKLMQRFIHNPFGSSKVLMKDGVFIEDREGPFSWNRCNYDLPSTSNGLAWFREWPEAVK